MVGEAQGWCGRIDRKEESMKVKIVARFKGYYSQKVPENTCAVIDRFKLTPSSRTGLSFRVINIWKKPLWIDSDWFK